MHFRMKQLLLTYIFLDTLLYAPYLGLLIQFSGARRMFKDLIGIYCLSHIKTDPHPRKVHFGTVQVLMPRLEIKRERERGMWM